MIGRWRSHASFVVVYGINLRECAAIVGSPVACTAVASMVSSHLQMLF